MLSQDNLCPHPIRIDPLYRFIGLVVHCRKVTTTMSLSAGDDELLIRRAAFFPAIRNKLPRFRLYDRERMRERQAGSYPARLDGQRG